MHTVLAADDYCNSSALLLLLPMMDDTLTGNLVTVLFFLFTVLENGNNLRKFKNENYDESQIVSL